jgi:hypothetical protein
MSGRRRSARGQSSESIKRKLEESQKEELAADVDGSNGNVSGKPIQDPIFCPIPRVF